MTVPRTLPVAVFLAALMAPPETKYPLGIYLFPQFIGFMVFMISAIAETNRAPFDLPEA